MNGRSTIKILFVILLALLLAWVACLVCCEWFTFLYGDQLMQIQNRPILIGEPEYIKVLQIRKNSAKVYFVEENMAGGHVLYLTKDNGIWTVTEWNSVWSGTGGSASSVQFPYIWHFVYGGL